MKLVEFGQFHGIECADSYCRGGGLSGGASLVSIGGRIRKIPRIFGGASLVLTPVDRCVHDWAGVCEPCWRRQQNGLWHSFSLAVLYVINLSMVIYELSI